MALVAVAIFQTEDLRQDAWIMVVVPPALAHCDLDLDEYYIYEEVTTPGA